MVAKSKKDPVIKTYLVKSPLRLGDEKIEPGQSIDMDEKEAKELVDCGVLEAPRAAPAAAE